MARAAETIAGRYELHDVLGRGGMSVVYKATDRVLDRAVAVKVLPAAYAENPVLVERFSREARAVARLSHRNIVAVYDSGFDRTVHYIVMECVRGVDLARLLKERGPLPVGEAVEITAEVTNALAAAHEAGIVHRDIKPANMMIQPSGTVKVLDFGIARARDDADLTRTTTVLGSAPYMPPEVAMGRPADERSDIYSLGCVLYEMLTGRPPFMADLPLAVMHLHANATAQPVRELRPEVPERLEALVLLMLAKDPADRPQRPAELEVALREALRDDGPKTAPTLVAPTRVAPPVASPPPEPAATSNPAPPMASTPAPPPQDETAAMRSPAKRSSRRAWLFAAAALIGLVAGIAVALASSSSSNRDQPTTGTQSHPRTSSSTSVSSTNPSSSSSSASWTSTTTPTQSTTTTSSSSTSSSPASRTTTNTTSSASSTQPAGTSSTAATSPTTTAP